MPQIVNKKSVLEMAMGAIAEITDYEVERVVANIMDPNTNATAKRIHASCDCEYAVRFDGRTSVAGYDPEAYLAQYNAAGGDINRMRRVNYAKNKERINAQKRAAYEARKTREDQ